MKVFSLEYERPLRFHWRNSDYRRYHSHADYWDFLFISKGSIIHKINNQKIIIEENSICIIRPSDVHSIHNVKGGKSSHINIAADATYLERLMSGLEEGLYENLINGPIISFPVSYLAAEEIKRCSNLILTAKKEKLLPLTKVLLLVFIKEYLLHKLGGIETGQENCSPPVKYLLEVLNDPSNYALTTKELFEQTHYSYSRVNELFNKEMGITFVKYFTEKKLDHAKRLLIDTDTRWEDIAFALGYSTYAHFAVFFKRKTGKTPTEYVNSYRGTLLNPIK